MLLRKTSGLFTCLAVAGLGLATTAMAKPVASPSEIPPGSLNELVRMSDAVEPLPIASTRETGEWWCNGEPDFINAQNSQSFDGYNARVADDFFLQEGKYYRFDSVRVVMAVSSNVPDPLVALDWWEDCNGEPSSLVATFVDPEVEFLGASTTWPGFDLYAFTWELDLFLPGYQRFWISPYGVGQGFYYWITSGEGVVQGVQGQYRNASVGYPDWTDGIDVVNLEYCSDYNFSIFGACCTLLKDNGDYDLEGLSSFKFPNNIQFSSRSVDNFQVPCGDAQQICRLEAYLATNCLPERGFLEIYSNDCDAPVDGPVYTLEEPTAIIPTGEFLDGLPVYCFRWDDVQGVVLEPERNYWLSMAIVGTGNINERGVFLFKSNAEECHINITEGQYRNAFAGYPDFTPVSDPGLEGQPRDFAFRLYTCPIQGDGVPGTGGVGVTANDPIIGMGGGDLTEPVKGDPVGTR